MDFGHDHFISNDFFTQEITSLRTKKKKKRSTYRIASVDKWMLDKIILKICCFSKSPARENWIIKKKKKNAQNVKMPHKEKQKEKWYVKNMRLMRLSDIHG